jgi:hypothetical protein
MWNYRIGTKKDGANTRVYSIFECYYDENGVPDSNIDDNSNILGCWEYLEDLKGTYDLIKLAFEKPIIDLDNFPNIFTEDTND